MCVCARACIKCARVIDRLISWYNYLFDEEAKDGMSCLYTMSVIGLLTLCRSCSSPSGPLPLQESICTYLYMSHEIRFLKWG